MNNLESTEFKLISQLDNLCYFFEVFKSRMNRKIKNNKSGRDTSWCVLVKLMSITKLVQAIILSKQNKTKSSSHLIKMINFAPACLNQVLGFYSFKKQKMIQKIFIIVLMVIAGVSCNNPGTNINSVKMDSAAVQSSKTTTSLPDISGYYRLPETGCDIALTITKEKNGFKYFFKGEHLDLEGIAILSSESDGYYVTFDGPIGNTPAKTVSGLFKDNTLTIQNEGNSQNNYHYFTDCDEKYLEFKKQ